MAKITHFPGRVEIEVPYNALIVDDLKTRVPPRYRTWDETRRIWNVWDPYVATAVGIIQTYIPNVTIIGEPQPAEQSRGGFYGDYFRRREEEREQYEQARQEQRAHQRFVRWDYEGLGLGQFRSKRRRAVYAAGSNVLYGPWEDNPDYVDPSGNFRDSSDWFRKNYRPGGGGQEAPGSPRTNGSQSSDAGVLFVYSDAPEAVYRAAYKALAILYHPDRGGDLRKMQDLNAAWDRIKKAKGWK